MITTHYPLDPRDAPVVAGIRQAMSAQKGKYLGVAARPMFEAQKNAVQAVPDVTTEPGMVGGVPGWWCHPPEARSDATLIYYHGGWYMLGSAEAFRNQASHFAALTRTRTFIPDYRRAPEAPFPAAVDDASAVYRDLAGRGIPKLAVVGDSAGGALSLIVLAAAVEHGAGLVTPIGGVAMSPTTDLALTGASMRTRAEADPIFMRDVAASFIAAYLDGADPRDPRASPLYGTVSGLPPIRIDVGDDEILLDDAVRYAERATAAGVEVTLGIWAGMPHTFQGSIGKLQAAGAAVEAEAEFLNQLLDRPT